jgi:Cu/Ag efflux protein CusF
MKSILRALAIASLALPLAAFPAEKADALSEGTVKKIDVANQRVMLKHGAIANLGMAPMTMMFKVRDPAQLKKLKDGDQVRFRAEEIGGDYTVVRIEPAR